MAAEGERKGLKNSERRVGKRGRDGLEVETGRGEENINRKGVRERGKMKKTGKMEMKQKVLFGVCH